MATIKNIILSVVIFVSVLSFVNCADDLLQNVQQSDSEVVEGRTFGHHFMKRISFAIIPAAFVVGVITTLLAALTVVSIKGLGVGVILLILAIGQMLSRTLSAPAAAAITAPVPVVYAHQHAAPGPVWVKEDW